MKHLRQEQRYTISIIKRKGVTQTEIAETIGIDKSTISREFKRNCDMRSGEYRSELAQ